MAASAVIHQGSLSRTCSSSPSFFRRTIMDEHEVRGANAALTSPAPQAAAVTPVKQQPQTADLRVQRLNDLLADAVQEPDPLRAGVRAAGADLLEIGYRLGVGIKAALAAQPAAAAAMAAYKDVALGINTVAMVYRQAARYLQLDRDLASDESPVRRKKGRQANNGDGEMKT
jgi:hypothetical protein